MLQVTEGVEPVSLRVWNWNHSLHDANRVGVKHCEVLLDHQTVWNGTLGKGCGNKSFDYSTQVMHNLHSMRLYDMANPANPTLCIRLLKSILLVYCTLAIGVVQLAYSNLFMLHITNSEYWPQIALVEQPVEDSSSEESEEEASASRSVFEGAILGNSSVFGGTGVHEASTANAALFVTKDPATSPPVSHSQPRTAHSVIFPKHWLFHPFIMTTLCTLCNYRPSDR